MGDRIQTGPTARVRTGITDTQELRLEKAHREMLKLMGWLEGYITTQDTVHFEVEVDPMWITVSASVTKGGA